MFHPNKSQSSSPSASNFRFSLRLICFILACVSMLGLIAVKWTGAAANLTAKPLSVSRDPQRQPEPPITNGQSARAPRDFAQLLTKAQADGSVRVIVGLRVPFQPEGLLANAQAVTLQRNAIAQAQTALLAGLSGVEPASIKRFAYIPYLALAVKAVELETLKASPLVNSIQEDGLHAPTLAESVPLIGAPAAWASGFTGAGQVVAILDTGVDKTHSFLSGKVVSEACYSTTDSSAGTASVCPGGVPQSVAPGSGVNCTVAGCEHGTHVAGIAAGKSAGFSGVAKDANIMAVQVFSKLNSCPAAPNPCVGAFTSDIILGLERLQTLSSSFSIAAANLSLGSGQFTSNCDTDPTKPAIDNLRSVGIATVVASGNDGSINALSSPSCISTAISVGATGDGSTVSGDTAALDIVSSFSNSAPFLSLLAPGQWINSSVPGGGFQNFAGTSMAAPHVTGAWAVLKSKLPTATVTQSLFALTSTGLAVTDGRNSVTKPRIKLDAAINALSAAPTIAPVLPMTITAENCGAPNNAIDPGETVTVNFSLQNIGASSTANLVAALQATGGLTAPSSPQTYGTLTPGGAAVTRPFSFTANGLCGSTLTATLQLQDGAANLGTVKFTFMLGGGVFTNVLTESFDSVSAPALPNGWTTARSGATPPAFWATRNTLSDTAPNTTFSNGVTSVATNDLISPAIVLPSGVGALQLTFRHTYSFESNFDGGVLELSSDSPGFTVFNDVISPTVGGSFVTGGYPSTISTNYGSALAGRLAWTGFQGSAFDASYTTVVLNLPIALAGQTVKLRWRGAWDSSEANTSPNWRIDTVALKIPSCPTCSCPTVSTINSTNGLIGSTVVITGTNFTDVTAVKFSNNVTATITSNTGTQLTVTVPAGAVTGPITISKTGCPDTQTSIFTVCSTLTLSPASLPNGTVGVSYNQTLTGSGGAAPYSFLVVSGALPTGLSLSGGGALTGTPSASGTFNFTIKATDNNGCIGTQAYSVTVTCPTITLSPASLPNGSVNTFYSQTITASGGMPGYSFSFFSGAPPPGLSMSAGGVLSGTPSAAGTFNFTVRATDANGCTGTPAYSMTIAANTPPLITPVAVLRQAGSPVSNSTIATVSDAETAAGALAVNVNGGSSATVNNVTVSGIGVSAAGVVTANVVAACTSFTASFTLRVTDGGGLFAEATLTVTVSGNTGPILTYANQSVAAGGSLTVNPASGPSDNGTVTSIVVLSQGTYTGTISVNNSTGVVSLSGAKPGGMHTITIRAADNCGSAVTDASFTLMVICPTITLSSPPLPNGTVGTSYNQTITASGGAPVYSFTLASGALPNGLSLAANGTLSGVPSAGGAFNFTIRATDQNGCPGVQAYSMTINTPPAIGAVAVSRQQGSPASNSTIANVSDADQAANTLAVTINGSATATVNGVTVNSISISAGGAVTANVVASCTATNASFTLTVTDSAAASNIATLNVTVTANSPPILTYFNSSVPAGSTLIVTPSTANDNGSITGYSVLSVTPAFTTAPTVSTSGVVTITSANPPGPHTITIRATDNCGATTDATFTVDVQQATATITVNSLADTAISGDGQCTLREAINNANVVGGQTTAGDCNPGGLSTTIINFSVTGTINLTGVLPDIARDVAITGPGPGQLDVHRNTGGIYRIFRVLLSTVTISGLTISNGQADSQGGGGIYNSGTLSLANCIVSGNTSPDSSAGGVASFFGSSLTINNCTISGNIAGFGGGIGVFGGTLMMSNSTVSGNTASGAQGGGLNLQDTTATISNSTISGNTASGGSGGGGGGIYNLATSGHSALVTLINCTITGNTGINSVRTSGNTGVISVVTQLKNTLVAANSGFNFSTSGAGAALTSQGNNLVSDGTSGFTNGVNGDIVGTNGSPIDARLGPLANYGGPTQTHALLCGSPALNAGNNTGAPATDQRGIARPVGGTVDIGAFETNISLGPTVLPAGTLGLAYNQTFTASGGSPGYTFSLLSGALPSGLTLNASGLFSGTPAQSGSFNFTVKATDAAGFAGACSFALLISCPTITISPPTIPGAIIGQPYSQSFMQTGGTGAVTFSLTGTLPPGLSFNAATATIFGTPTQVNSFSVTIKATDANGCMGVQSYSLPVNCPVLNFNPINFPNGTTGVGYNQTITVTGGSAPYSLAIVAGALPTGLTLSSTGVISGAPTQTGTFTFSVTATDANNCSAQFNGYQIVISCATVTVNPVSIPGGQLGVLYNQTFTQTGGVGAVGFSLSAGTLPTGLTLSAGGILSGMPGQSGSFPVTIKATDAAGCMGTRAYTLVISPCQTITISPVTLPNGTSGVAYNQALTASGGTAPYTFSISGGGLPSGMGLTSGGVLSGTPTTFGTFNFTAKATDAIACIGTQAYVLVINPPCGTITVNPASLPNGFVGTIYSQTLTASGGATPYSFAISAGNLPGGLALAPSGALNGAPTTQGTFNFTIKTTDANGCQGTRDYTVVISGSGLMYYPLPRPIRLFDTRGPIPGFPACEYLSQPLTGGVEFVKQARITCDGIAIPADAQAIVGNATVVFPSGDGYIILWPDGEVRPPASNLNYVAGQVVPNAFTLRLGTNGQFRVYSPASTDFLIDITGYFAPPKPTGLYYHPLPRPIRLFDTRGPIPGFPACEYLSQPLTGGVEFVKQARIACDGITIPADAQAIVGNATVVTPSGSGYILIWPDGQPRPPASVLNYVTGQIVPNAFTVGLGGNGQFRIFPLTNTDFIVDITGYYSPSPSDANGTGLLYSPLARPIRLFDTRGPIPGFPACEYLNQPLVGGVEFVKQARITCDNQTIPSNAQAIVANATVVVASGDGYIIIWPDGQPRPPASNLNYVTGQIVPNAFTVKLGGNGQFRIYPLTNTGFIVDIAGFYAP